MPLTDLENRVLHDIHNWENRLSQYEANDFQLTFEKYFEQSFSLLPEKVQYQFFSVINDWMFHLNAMIQGSELQTNAKDRILSSARCFNPEVEDLSDLKMLELNQLSYIAQQHIARHRFYSFAQGGLSGSGSSLLLGADIPALAVINLRAVQLVAMSYGFEMNTPFEMMSSLHVFRAATLPKRMQSAGWKELIAELDGKKDPYFYEGSEEIIDVPWIEQPLSQILKAMVIFFFRRKTIQGIPLMGMTIGAGLNYRLTKNVTEFAQHYYLLRFLQEKEEKDNEYTRT